MKKRLSRFQLGLVFYPCSIALVLVSATTLNAQLKPEEQTGSRIPVKPKRLTSRETSAVGKGFARCIYRNNARLLPDLLEHSDPVTIDFEALKTTPGKLVQKMGMELCLSEQAGVSQDALGLRMQPGGLRSLLLEEDYLAKFPSPPQLPAGAIEPLAHRFVSTSSNLPHVQALAAFADCVIFKNTSGADALLRTAPGTDKEMSAARALAPSLGTCLVQGQMIKLTPPSIRTIVADGLWSRYVRPNSAAGSIK